MRVSIDRLRRIIKEEAKKSLRSRGLREATREIHNLEDDLLGMEPELRDSDTDDDDFFQEGESTLELTVRDDDGEHRATVTKRREVRDYYTLTVDGEEVAGGKGVGAITQHMLDNRMVFDY